MASALSLIEIEIELIESCLRRQRVFRDRLNAYSDFEFITSSLVVGRLNLGKIHTKQILV